MRSLPRILATPLFLPATAAHADGFGLNVRAGTLGVGRGRTETFSGP